MTLSQNERLLDFLRDHPAGITQLIAFGALGVCRLSERVRELESQGYVFTHDWQTVPTRDGSARVMCYRLLAEPHERAYG